MDEMTRRDALKLITASVALAGTAGTVAAQKKPKVEDVMEKGKSLKDVTPAEVEVLFAQRAPELHRKVDNTRDAYFGFIFPITRDDFGAVAQSMEMSEATATVLYKKANAFSTFRPVGQRGGQVTNHILGTSILALRGKDLNTGLDAITDKNLAEIVSDNKDIVLKIADARASWFGRIFFPTAAFSRAIAVFGGKVSSDAIYGLAEKYGFAAKAGNRKTVRGDFGIGVWLTLLGKA
jgi:hypothetical protein